MWEFLAGTALMLGGLVALGITRGRWVPQRRWVALWSVVSISLVAVMTADFLFGDGVSELVFGLAAGYVAGVTIHTLHHFSENLQQDAT